MWAAKLPGEGAALADACEAMVTVMAALGVAVDGGKDSLSMAARVGTETVQAPGKAEALVRGKKDLWAWAGTSHPLISLCSVGSLVISAYAVCPDITATVTPDLKHPGGKGIAPSPLFLCICSELIPCFEVDFMSSGPPHLSPELCCFLGLAVGMSYCVL